MPTVTEQMTISPMATTWNEETDVLFGLMGSDVRDMRRFSSQYLSSPTLHV
jgi:hypothetical protein